LSPVGTSTIGLPCSSWEACMTPWNSAAVGSRKSTFLPSISRFSRSAQKFTDNASKMWPPTRSSIFLPSTVLNVDLSVSEFKSSRMSTIWTSSACACSHCGVTSGPGNTLAWTAPKAPKAIMPIQPSKIRILRIVMFPSQFTCVTKRHNKTSVFRIPTKTVLR
jgi:hypothetical protein